MAKIAHLILLLNLNCLLEAEARGGQEESQRDLRWPQRQVRVLMDAKSLNSSELKLLDAVWDQLEHRTCLRVERLSVSQVNAFERERWSSNGTQRENNFIYLLKATDSSSTSQSIGLSSLGCLRQGRQSIILTELAFARPRPVLAYHVLRALGVANLTRPAARFLELPAGQKIGDAAPASSERPEVRRPDEQSALARPKFRPASSQEYLSEADLARVKELYNCSEYSSRLPAGEQPAVVAAKPANAELASEPPSSPDTPLFPASPNCRPLESCSLPEPTASEQQQLELERTPRSGAADDERPMILKLDPFHAQDPELQQANQMKLSVAPGGGGGSEAEAESYRLLNAPLAPQGGKAQQEMLISFEQTPVSANSSSPVAALASSQVLKLCSCTCQTMTANGGQASTTTSTTTTTPPQPTISTRDDQEPEETWPPTATTTLAPVVVTTTTTTAAATTTTEEPATEAWPTTTTLSPTGVTTQPPIPSSPPPTTTEEPSTTSTSPRTTRSEPPATETSSPSPGGGAHCNQVEWVKPNKTVYGSARIVWDVDRANQNYFLCQNAAPNEPGELVPGKTHGLSCQVSSAGKAYELHDFKVLTKPESVSLAWVQRNNPAFGTTNLPVVGGHSRQPGGDPYLVSRCLVRDENNDVITLIGYVNSQGHGWFPFDDIQIECGQYDVLACV